MQFYFEKIKKIRTFLWSQFGNFKYFIRFKIPIFYLFKIHSIYFLILFRRFSTSARLSQNTDVFYGNHSRK
ncbi:hypothetical protein LEP1GSC120_2257 [Leptospira santarosai str. 200702252]|nr:hypothetical protein LEP1GSC130_1351 [Leptospira santarosai str. 200403458]EMO98449.1 hypothetical protein LEP1GSC120_2257 [Leptospira santarosai str. 200702252]